MRQLELLINQSRVDTDNIEFSDTTGIPDSFFIQRANDAQDRIHSLILQQHPDIFLKEKIISSVYGQEAYSAPSDCYLGNRIVQVDYSPSGNENDYFQLKQGRLPERISGIQGVPAWYIRRSGAILLQPKPQSDAAKIRLTYQKKLAKLDIRRATVSAVTLTTDEITSLTLDTTVAFDQTSLVEENFLTVVDKNGVVKMASIPFTDIDATTGVVTIEAGFTFEDGETIEVGDYVCKGALSTTHSELPDVCERYLIAYMDWKVLKKDSSADSIEQSEELQAMEAEIIDTFKETDDDVDYVTILDDGYLEAEEF